jgi:hypothetical protein
MRIRYWVFFLTLPAAAAAQSPLNAIDWLGQNSPEVRTGPVLLEPPVTATALHPQVEVQPLTPVAEPVGLVPSSVTGLPENLWRGSDVQTLTELIAEVPVLRIPAMQTLLYTLLLSETRPPEGNGAAEAMLLARIDRLMELGAADPAQSLVESAGPTRTTERFRRWFDAALLTGNEDPACAELTSAPHLLDDYAARIFCIARTGDWQTAALTLEAAHALEVLPQDQLDLMDRFLSPEIFDGAPPLPAPNNPDPLTFRIFEAIGERLPTATLPRAFATADLRDVAGWKAQVEAAERLTRVGALPPNRLLGLYTERQPAASGGIWDRIDALQLFETALASNSPEAVAKTLPAVWSAMQAAKLEVPFATLFADQLAALPLDDARARAIAWKMQLLSPSYETAARTPLGQGRTDAFLAALALGDPNSVAAPGGTAQAIADGFAADARPPARIESALNAGRLGEAILLAMEYFDQGASGNPANLTGALATFRKLGLEDITRRAALQVMLLDRS